MIQLDPRKRPRVEDLESLPSLQPAMNAAKAIANDYKSQQVSLLPFFPTINNHNHLTSHSMTSPIVI